MAKNGPRGPEIFKRMFVISLSLVCYQLGKMSSTRRKVPLRSRVDILENIVRLSINCYDLFWAL